MEIIQNNVMQSQVDKSLHTDSSEKYWLRLFSASRIYKPFILLIALFLFQQISGPYVIIFYAIDLFVKIGGQFGDHINEYGAMLMLGVLRFIMSILCALYVFTRLHIQHSLSGFKQTKKLLINVGFCAFHSLSKHIGRRKFLLSSGLGMNDSSCDFFFCLFKLTFSQ